MKNFFFILFIFGLWSTNLIAGYDFQQESDKIVSKFLKEIRPLKIRPSGIGGGSIDEINTVSVFLTCYQNLNLDEAKNLHARLLLRLINDYNSNVQIRPYLHNFPFTHDNFHFMISFEDASFKRVSSEYIALILIAKNRIFYESYDHSTNTFNTVHDEPVESVFEEHCKQLKPAL